MADPNSVLNSVLKAIAKLPEEQQERALAELQKRLTPAATPAATTARPAPVTQAASANATKLNVSDFKSMNDYIAYKADVDASFKLGPDAIKQVNSKYAQLNKLNDSGKIKSGAMQSPTTTGGQLTKQEMFELEKLKKENAALKEKAGIKVLSPEDQAMADEIAMLKKENALEKFEQGLISDKPVAKPTKSKAKVKDIVLPPVDPSKDTIEHLPAAATTKDRVYLGKSDQLKDAVYKNILKEDSGYEFFDNMVTKNFNGDPADYIVKIAKRANIPIDMKTAKADPEAAYQFLKETLIDGIDDEPGKLLKESFAKDARSAKKVDVIPASQKKTTRTSPLTRMAEEADRAKAMEAEKLDLLKTEKGWNAPETVEEELARLRAENAKYKGATQPVEKTNPIRQISELGSEQSDFLRDVKYTIGKYQDAKLNRAGPKEVVRAKALEELKAISDKYKLNPTDVESKFSEMIKQVDPEGKKINYVDFFKKEDMIRKKQGKLGKTDNLLDELLDMTEDVTSKDITPEIKRAIGQQRRAMSTGPIKSIVEGAPDIVPSSDDIYDMMAQIYSEGKYQKDPVTMAGLIHDPIAADKLGIKGKTTLPKIQQVIENKGYEFSPVEEGGFGYAEPETGKVNVTKKAIKDKIGASTTAHELDHLDDFISNAKGSDLPMYKNRASNLLSKIPYEDMNPEDIKAYNKAAHYKHFVQPDIRNQDYDITRFSQGLLDSPTAAKYEKDVVKKLAAEAAMMEKTSKLSKLAKALKGLPLGIGLGATALTGDVFAADPTGLLSSEEANIGADEVIGKKGFDFTPYLKK